MCTGPTDKPLNRQQSVVNIPGLGCEDEPAVDEDRDDGDPGHRVPPRRLPPHAGGQEGQPTSIFLKTICLAWTKCVGVTFYKCAPADM